MNQIQFLSTREAYGETLVSIGKVNKSIIVLDADLSLSTQTNGFRDKFPDRFFDVGCAEQNLVGTAAGIANEGKIVFASTYAIFAMRAWEQIRNCIAYDEYSVKIAVSHSGLSNAPDGASHQSMEDVALMCVIPNMYVYSPSDAKMTQKVIEYESTRKGPAYIRLSREKTPVLYDDSFLNFDYHIWAEGNDITIISTGPILNEILKANYELINMNISSTIIDVIKLKPFPEGIGKYILNSKIIITVEEHNTFGGLGSLIWNIFPIKCSFFKIGIKDSYGESGKYSELLHKHRLDSESIVQSILCLMKS